MKTAFLSVVESMQRLSVSRRLSNVPGSAAMQEADQ